MSRQPQKATESDLIRAAQAAGLGVEDLVEAQIPDPNAQVVDLPQAGSVDLDHWYPTGQFRDTGQYVTDLATYVAKKRIDLEWVQLNADLDAEASDLAFRDKSFLKDLLDTHGVANTTWSHVRPAPTPRKA